jgi:dihydrodipicolinate synthase/N-acetylneuraminate lyase
MLIGGVGWMAGPECLVPSQSVALYDLCRQGKWDGVITLRRDLWPLNETFGKYNLAACDKGGLSLQGYDVGVPLAPQSPLSAEGQEEIRRVLGRLGAP